MAIEKVTKVLVAVHKEHQESFLKALQRSGILHVTRTETGPDQADSQTSAQSVILNRLAEAIELLKARADKKGKARPVLTRSEFEEIVQHLDPSEPLDHLNRLARELSELDNRLKAIDAERARLLPWQGLQDNPQELYGLRSVTILLGRFADRAELMNAKGLLAQEPVAIETVGEEDGAVLVMIASAPDVWERVSATLSGMRFETADLRNVEGRPAEILAELKRERDEVEKRRVELESEISRLTRRLVELQAVADALANEESRKGTELGAEQTGTVLLMHGWVRNRDIGKLKRLVDEAEYAALAQVEPDPDEEPPVALVNRPVFRPFELVLELFSLPSPKELDPTWLIAPFFGTFFALCLTDAGYGIVVALLTYLLMRRLGASNKLLGIVLIGGLLTIPAGALVGGWFGDVFDRLGLGWLAAFKNRLMWFDPLKEPMKFFILSVALGYLQLISGIAFEIADCLRVRNWGDGLLGQMPWFLGLNSLVIRVVFGRMLPGSVNTLLMVILLGAMAAIVVFNQREKATLPAQWILFGLLASVFLYFGARFGWLPRVFLLSRWLVLAILVAMTIWAWLSMIQKHRMRPVLAVLGILAGAGIAFYFVRLLPAVVTGVLATVFFLAAPTGRGLFSKLAWGGYALYGATGYIGVVLSYIRLMALGMCTGGVAMAINVIAWMLFKVPVIGIVLGLVVLIGGHAYNIAVNVLGAFVHSLRLQYVEFFPRFYTGGGERFSPLAERFNYIKVQ
ncbi:MAG: hypothetical protein ABIK44_07175 [candidate division WOR-3 bacterium]